LADYERVSFGGRSGGALEAVARRLRPEVEEPRDLARRAAQANGAH
jgi:hypothetical protein